MSLSRTGGGGVIGAMGLGDARAVADPGEWPRRRVVGFVSPMILRLSACLRVNSPSIRQAEEDAGPAADGE